MLNQKIQNPNPDELMIEVDLCYELDPYELKLDEMIEAEPEPEMIAISNCSSMFSRRKFSPTVKPFPTAHLKWTRWIS